MLRVESASKTYLPPPALLRLLIRSAARRPVPALHAVSLTVNAGEVVGLVGPNGAGKTTLIKMIATLLEQDRGRITVDGYDTVRDARETRRRVGLVLAEDRGLYWRLTGRHNLELFGILCGLPRVDARRRAGELLEEVGLAALDKLVFGYSAGMRSRLALARALMTRPPLLVLDEPTRSLDPVAAAEVGALLRRLADQGHAILFASHRVNELTEVCDRVVVLDGGRVAFAGTLDDPGLGDAGDPARSIAVLLRHGPGDRAGRTAAALKLSADDLAAFRASMRDDSMMLTDTAGACPGPAGGKVVAR